MVTEAEDRVRAGGPGPATRRAAVNAAVVAAPQIAGKVAGLAYTIAAVRVPGERQFGTFAGAMSFCCWWQRCRPGASTRSSSSGEAAIRGR